MSFMDEMKNVFSKKTPEQIYVESVLKEIRQRDDLIKTVSQMSSQLDHCQRAFDNAIRISRINALRRRSEIPDDTKKKLVFDKLVINLDSYELLVDGKKVDTPPKELELLYHLAATPNRVYTRNQLLDEVWGFDYFGDSRTVDVHIKRLREKIENVSDQWELKTVWGVGYKFEVK